MFDKFNENLALQEFDEIQWFFAEPQRPHGRTFLRLLGKPYTLLSVIRSAIRIKVHEVALQSSAEEFILNKILKKKIRHFNWANMEYLAAFTKHLLIVIKKKQIVLQYT